MNKVSLVSPNYMVGPVSQNSYYLPYSAGILWNHAYYNSDLVRDNYQIDQLVWRRDDIEQVAQEICDNAIVGFSTYIWNDKYNNALAKRIKELNPGCLIVFGGPQVPITRTDLFQVYPYIDICVKTEGEYVFRQILEQYVTDKDYVSIKGLLYNDRNRLTNSIVDTGEAIRIDQLDTLPSPYLSGLFDDIIADNPDVNWSMVIETTRGCPYQCTFCDWGSLTYSKVKKFNLERCLDEIEWMGRNQIEFLYIADANFGMYVDRDLAIAQKIIEVKKTYGNPKALHTTWAKNQKADVIKIAETFNKGGMRQPLNVSVQSLDEKTLENIKRSNLEMNKVADLYKMCEERSMPMFTELICGLPGETLTSWKQNFYGLYEAGNHEGVAVYQCAVLENAELNLDQIDAFEIEKVSVKDYILGSEHEKDLTYAETFDVVTATKDMPRNHMVEAQVFSWYQSTFHVKGLTNYISRFLRKSINESYENFYTKLWEHLIQDEWYFNQVEEIRHIYNEWFNDGERIHDNVGNISITAMNLVMMMTIKLHHERKFDYVHNLVENFVMSEYYKLFEDDIISELLDFQRNNTIRFENLEAGAVTRSYNYNFLGYIFNNDPIKQKTEYRFGLGPYEDEQGLKTTFLERLWYSKRYNAGVAQITYNTTSKIES